MKYTTTYPSTYLSVCLSARSILDTCTDITWDHKHGIYVILPAYNTEQTWCILHPSIYPSPLIIIAHPWLKKKFPCIRTCRTIYIDNNLQVSLISRACYTHLPAVGTFILQLLRRQTTNDRCMTRSCYTTSVQ